MQTTPEIQAPNAFDRLSDNYLNTSAKNLSTEPIEVKVPEILFDLIPKYLENRRNETKALVEAIKIQDFAAIKSIGHKLKGNAGSYGFTYLTELGAMLENAAVHGDLLSVQESVHSYQSYLTRVKPVPES